MISSFAVVQHWFVFGWWLITVAAAENNGQRTGHLMPKVDDRRRMLQDAEIPEMDSPEYWAQQERIMGEGVSSIADQFTEFEQTVDDTTLICEGEVTLYRLSCPVDACDDNNNNQDHGGCASRCKASFCQLDFDLQKQDPARYPTFLDLVGASAHCDSAPITVEFNDIVRACRAYDLDKAASQQPHTIPLTGLVTELGYTDAELMTTAMTARSGLTDRVLVDPQPVLEAMTMCDDGRKRRQRQIRNDLPDDARCSRVRAASLLRDVLYLYARARDAAARRLWLKVAPAAVTGLDVFEIATAAVPWVFVYDEPRAAMGAQFDTGRVKPERAACAATKKDPPPELSKVTNKGTTTTTAEYCAAYLGMLATAAYERAQAGGRGRLVKSEDVLTSLGDMMENHFNVHDFFDGETKNHVKTLEFLTDPQGNEKDLDLQTKSREKKLASLTKEYEEASVKYYGDVFEKMEQYGDSDTTTQSIFH